MMGSVPFKNRIDAYLFFKMKKLLRGPCIILIAGVRFYRFFVSPWLGAECRFYPSCSAYALGALKRHGALKGVSLAVRRFCRCHPGCAGGHDPIP
jgi:putative membrane protein insertion efficiency factor